MEEHYKPLIININNSRKLTFLLYSQLGLVIVVMTLSPGLGVWRWPLLAVLGCYGYYCHRLFINRDHPKTIKGLRDNENRDWFIKFNDSENWQACKIQNAWAGRWVIILSLKWLERPGRRSLVLMPDAVDPEDMRRLRVFLRGFG